MAGGRQWRKTERTSQASVPLNPNDYVDMWIFKLRHRNVVFPRRCDIFPLATRLVTRVYNYYPLASSRVGHITLRRAQNISPRGKYCHNDRMEGASSVPAAEMLERRETCEGRGS